MRHCLIFMCAVIASPIGAQERLPVPEPLPVPELAAGVCAPCHTVDGIGKDVEIPNLAGQHVIYLYNQLKAFHVGARKHAEMKIIARDLTDREMRELAAYYASLPTH